VTIDGAITAAQRGDWFRCLELLVAAWRPHREPELAVAIERVAERVRAPSMEPSTKAVAARVATATLADVGPILATIKRQLRKQARLLDQLVALSTRIGPEPRIADLLAEIFEATPFARASSPSELPVLAALEAIDDPRHRPMILRTAAKIEATSYRHGAMIARLDRIGAVARAIEARPSPAPLARSLAALEAELARPFAFDTAPLLAAIYADPDNTEARLVYADALQEQGDPRGEFIALQCAGTTPSRRERALLRVHEREWLGGLDAHVLKHGVVFRRGFVAAAVLGMNVGDLPTDPGWHTLEELDLGVCWNDPIARWLPTLRGLRRVAHFYNHDFKILIDQPPMRWRSFGIRYGTKEFGARFANHHRTMFPLLEELDLSACTQQLTHILFGLKGGDFTTLRLRISATMREHIKAARGLKFRELELVPGYEFQPTRTIKVVIANDRITAADPDFLARISELLPAPTRR
jgi:uncharacterized protein (TIGR02996 family)